MQDVERNVPIDTSGNEVDVDIEETKDEAVVEQKEETVFVLDGVLRVWSSESEKDYVDLRPGDVFHVSPMQIHRFGCPKNSKYATVIMEVSTCFLEDVVRLQDDYKR